MRMVPLGEYMVSRGGSVNPANFPDEPFELYSIPAHDSGGPEMLEGKLIGSSKQLVRPGDVMISKIIPHIRRVRIVEPFSGNRQIASSEWIVFRGGDLLPEYLRHFLLSNRFHARFLNTVAGVGGSLVRARPQFVKSIEAPVPPLEEQRRIAAILDKADSIRAKRRQVLDHLDALTQSIFLDMFGDPVSNSRGLPTASLSELGNLDRGVSKHRPRNDPALLGGRYPLIQTGDVSNSGGYIDSFSSTYSDLGVSQSKIWPAGTLCITIAANIAKTGILTIDACFPDSVVAFTSDPATTIFVQSWLGFLQATLEANAPQSAQKNINLKVLRGLKVLLPPMSERGTYSQVVNSVTERRSDILRCLKKDDELFASLQSRAFKGEL